MANRSKVRNRDHDIFIKGILSLDELVLLLLHRYIPQELKRFMDFSSFKSLPESKIDNKLVAQYTDSIHECALLKSALPENIQNILDLPNFRFCFLWEHKSSKPNEPIEAQVERYRYAIIGSDLKNGRKPSIVIPIVLYHGETKWTIKMVYEQFEPYLPSEILKLLPRPHYIFIDIRSTTKEEIEKMVDLKVLRAAFIALKNAHEPKFFQNNMEEVFKFVETSSSKAVFDSFFKMLLEYMQRRSQLQGDIFNELVEQKLEPTMVTNFKTIFEVAEEKAKIEGKIEGEIQKSRVAIINMLKLRTFPIEQIADVLEVELEFVKQMQTELEVNPNLKA
ncbi:MAG: Rpn family recombination-promoting nuclease/putative transposase [Saprospiraceae bacterium]|nr:Rpn family recombination-promoting nuclease/putative transposase [Saprospiraceae bacterium]